MNKIKISIYLLAFFSLCAVGFVKTIRYGHYNGEKALCKVRRIIKTEYQCGAASLDKIIEHNSYSALFKIDNRIKHKERSAALFLNGKNQVEIFTQQAKIINPNQIKKIVLPTGLKLIENPQRKEHTKLGTIIKSVFRYQGITFGLAVVKGKECSYSTLFNTINGHEFYRLKCIKEKNEYVPNGIGGGFAEFKNGFLLTFGAPESTSEKIRFLAQDDNYLYGKIIYFELNEDKTKLIPKIFAKGFKNPQGLEVIDGLVFATDHGPRGGDEVNLIEDGNNYGWPFISLGIRYAGEKYPHYGDPNDYQGPLHSFQPSIGISDITACPKALADYYKNYTCLLISSLRGMSHCMTKKNEES